VNRLRNRLILVFLAATLPPLAVTLWITTSLLERSLRYTATRELDEVSTALERTARELYQRERESLRREAHAGKLTAESYPLTQRGRWPAAIGQFWQSGEAERFLLAGNQGDRLEYLLRRPEEVHRFSRPIQGVRMHEIREQYARARGVVEEGRSRDLRRGFLYTFLLVAAVPWLAALALLVYSTHRISRPIHELAAALTKVGAGDLAARVGARRDDEIGTAIDAFNHMAGQLQHSRERLLYLTRLEGWQALARKMAHELKNSLTPIRLTVEEVVARKPQGDGGFPEQAAQIVVEEVNALERRVRAFSEFAAEPPVQPVELDLNALVTERIAFLKTAHPDVAYQFRPRPGLARARADEDLVKAALTNLLENAAEAAGAGGLVLASTCEAGRGIVAVEVHDSGPGLSAQARATLFAPTISFKKGGMGLGLSIARKSALLCGGDIVLGKGELGGAAFRLVLPAA